MALSPGTRIGPYEVVGPLGAGGMGEVYRARDTKLDRDVAIKVLPESFALDADRVARFTREAKTLAALNHPNIAQIYGIEDAGGTQALVMELVEGQTLEEQIKAHFSLSGSAVQLPDWALPIARQIAEALDAAHGQGIVHRDLKPANIKIRPDGTVKVLDFGLAKAVDPVDSSGSALANSPTLTARATGMGMIIGTAAYMAPEQAKGRTVDKRADIWAFGAVLYEMLSGQRAFKGDDVSETLASVLKDTPVMAALPASTPSRLKELIGRCLERDVRLRQRDMGDVIFELGAIDRHGDDGQPRSVTPRRSPLAMISIGAVILAAGLAGGWLLPRGKAPSSESVRFTVPPPIDYEARSPQLTPDGRTLVFSVDRLYRRSLDTFETVPIPGTDGAVAPMISPDGKSVAFFARNQLMRVSLAGGDPVPITEAGRGMPGGCWCTDDLIVFSRSWATGLSAVPAAGGPVRQMTELDTSKGERGHWRPQPLPGGHHALFAVMPEGRGVVDSRIAVLDLDTGQYRDLFAGADPRYLETGHILYFYGGAWRLVPFDASAERTSGEPIAVLPDAFGVLPDGGESGNRVATSATGVLAYQPGPTVLKRELVWADRSGALQPVGLPPSRLTRQSVSLSPDGRRVAMDRLEAGTVQLWVGDLARKTEERLDVKGSNLTPLWAASGEWLAFVSVRKGQYDSYVARPDGSGERALLTADFDEQPVAWSHDGRRIVAREWLPDGSRAIVSVDAMTGKPSGDLSSTAFSAVEVRFSPDDRWLLISGSPAGRSEVYVRRFVADAPVVRVSTDGGMQPYWSPDGRTLYFLAGNTVMTTTFHAEGDRPVPGVPHALITLPASSFLYGVVGDGERFLVGRPAEPEPAPGIRVVTNWFSELTGKVR